MDKRTPATVLKPYCLKYELEKVLGRFKEKRIRISSKNNSEKKGHLEKNWARKRETF